MSTPVVFSSTPSTSVRPSTRPGTVPAPATDPPNYVSMSSSSPSASSPAAPSSRSTSPASASTTKSSSKPPSSSSNASVQSTSNRPNTTGGAILTTSVTVVRGSNTTPRTVEVTAQPSITLENAVVSTSTDGNGSRVVTTPPLVTIMSTSTEPDGALTTLTQVVANPPSAFGAVSKSSGILQNQGALAGIFIAVGLVVAAFIVGLIFFIRHRRRHNARKRWLAGMQQQRPSSLSGDPFRDPHDGSLATAPVMRSVERYRDQDQDQDQDQNDIHYTRRNPSPLVDVPLSHDRRSFGHGTSILPGPHPAMSGSDSEDHHPLDTLGLAYSTDFPRHAKRGSYAPSSPSLYPASLPPDDDEDSNEMEEGVANLKTRDPFVVPVPPRPPRSHLRQSSKGVVDYIPMTPPASVSSQLYSKTPSPISETRVQDVFARRTLLDVRTRDISP